MTETDAHELRTLPEYFRLVFDGTKTFEVRRDDRGFQVGHILLLREWALHGGYTGRELTARVVYLLKGGKLGIEEGYVVMGVELLQRSSTSSRLAAAEGSGG